jgi:hypothetical protein
LKVPEAIADSIGASIEETNVDAMELATAKIPTAYDASDALRIMLSKSDFSNLQPS